MIFRCIVKKICKYYSLSINKQYHQYQFWKLLTLCHFTKAMRWSYISWPLLTYKTKNILLKILMFLCINYNFWNDMDISIFSNVLSMSWLFSTTICYMSVSVCITVFLNSFIDCLRFCMCAFYATLHIIAGREEECFWNIIVQSFCVCPCADGVILLVCFVQIYELLDWSTRIPLFICCLHRHLPHLINHDGNSLS